MADQPYSNRELDAKFTAIQEGLQIIDVKVESGFRGVHARQDKTNGRLNKQERVMLIVGTAVVVLIVLKFPELQPLLHLV